VAAFARCASRRAADCESAAFLFVEHFGVGIRSWTVSGSLEFLSLLSERGRLPSLLISGTRLGNQELTGPGKSLVEDDAV
jgi:hypothetical protein